MDTSNIQIMAFRFSECGAHTDLGYFKNALDTSEFDEFRASLAESGGEIVNMAEHWTGEGNLCVMLAYTLPEAQDEPETDD